MAHAVFNCLLARLDDTMLRQCRLTSSRVSMRFTKRLARSRLIVRQSAGEGKAAWHSVPSSDGQRPFE